MMGTGTSLGVWIIPGFIMQRHEARMESNVACYRVGWSFFGRCVTSDFASLEFPMSQYEVSCVADAYNKYFHSISKKQDLLNLANKSCAYVNYKTAGAPYCVGRREGKTRSGKMKHSPKMQIVIFVSQKDFALPIPMGLIPSAWLLIHQETISAKPELKHSSLTEL